MVRGRLSGSFEFVQYFVRSEEYPPGEIRNTVYGMWTFEEDLTEFPSFSASQMVDALLWANKMGDQVMQILEGKSQ